jgi:hypothetical protein
MRTIVTKASEVGFTFHKIYNMTLKKPMPLHTTIYRVFALKKPICDQTSVEERLCDHSLSTCNKKNVSSCVSLR